MKFKVQSLRFKLAYRKYDIVLVFPPIRTWDSPRNFPTGLGLIAAELQRAGYRVVVGQNGREAWELAQDDQFDLIITDQQMPEMTGCELCERLRENESYRDTPIIMLTAKGLELELPRLRERFDITATFLKPFSPKEVVQTVEDCLTEAVS